MPEYGGLGDRIKELESQVAKLNRARRLESASIGSGGITVRDGGQISFLDTSGNTLFTIDENGLITFEADGSQLSVLDGTRLRFNRSDGTRSLEITPAGGAKFYASNGTTEVVVLDASGLDVGGGDVIATYTDVKEASTTLDAVTLTDTMQEFTNTSFALPSWVASAKVLAIATILGRNTTAGQIGIRASARVNDVDDGLVQSDAPAGTRHQAVHVDEATINTAVDGFTVQISAYGQRNGGSNIDGTAAVWGLIIGYAT
jgi:hypothetical protein